MQEIFIKSFDGTRLFFNKQTIEEPKGAVVFVHGLCEHQGRYDWVAEQFRSAGYSTYRFDHRGHGRSEGVTAHYNDYNELLDDTNFIVDLAIEENPGLPVFVYGHSMGGFAVALWGAKYPNKPIAGIICNGGLTEDAAGFLDAVPDGLDPLTELPNELGDGVCSVDEVRDWYGKDPNNRHHFTCGLVYAIRNGIAWFTTRKKDFAYPVLLTHGEKDGIISPKDTIDMFNEISSEDKQMKIYGKLCHEVHNEYCREEVISDYINWMNHRA